MPPVTWVGRLEDLPSKWLKDTQREQPSFMPPPSIHVVEEGPDGVTHAEASSDGH